MSLKEYLKKNGIKNCELAQLLGLDPGKVSICLNGITPWPIKYIPTISEFLDIPVEDVLSNKISPREGET